MFAAIAKVASLSEVRLERNRPGCNTVVIHRGASGTLSSSLSLDCDSVDDHAWQAGR